MKRIKFIAILAVASFGIGGAVIASNNAQTANVMNIGTEASPNWVPLTDTDGCEPDSQRPCTGYQEFPGGPVQILERGTKN